MEGQAELQLHMHLLFALLLTTSGVTWQAAFKARDARDRTPSIVSQDQNSPRVKAIVGPTVCTQMSAAPKVAVG
jgi:hypothetical protein